MERSYIIYHTGLGCLTGLIGLAAGTVMIIALGHWSAIEQRDWLWLVCVVLIYGLALTLGYCVDKRSRKPKL
jgi:hypothetical protein